MSGYFKVFRNWICWKLKVGWELVGVNCHHGYQERYSPDPCEPIWDQPCLIRERTWLHSESGRSRIDEQVVVRYYHQPRV